tara:strand:+ start:1352 stop:1501 length:150 start_codon:yes stop_codon:yes gene_type:complete
MACSRKLKKQGYTWNKETKMCEKSKDGFKTSVNKKLLKKKKIRRLTGTF